MIGLLAPSFDTCIALADAGFPQHTALGWMGRGPLSAPVLRPRHTPTSLRRRVVAAPMLEEIVAQLPTAVEFQVAHPIYSTVRRPHTLRMEVGEQTQFGYHLPGSFDVKHRTTHARSVEAAAQLFLTLQAAGKLATPQPVPTRTSKPLARAA